MLRNLALVALVGTASAALELTPDNFDTEVLKSGKSAFIKFLAPW
jgi:protein disulfide-isomerase A6